MAEFERIIDPGNEPSAAKPNTLPWLRSLVQKHQGFDLKSSEVWLFEKELQRLEQIIRDAGIDAVLTDTTNVHKR